MSLPNVSADLIWQVVRNQNAYLVKRTTCGGAQFSRDPLNLTNQHSRKHAGFVNDKAIGVSANEKGGVVVTSKVTKNHNKPAKHHHTNTHNKTSRKTYKAIANLSASRGYRGDLREAAVQRASAIRRSQRAPKADPEKKLRGKKAQQAAAAN